MHENILECRTRLSEKELAEYWGIKVNTLQKWRTLGVGPVYIKIGARVIYKRESIEEYEQKRTFRGSSQRIHQNNGGADGK